MKRKTTSVLAAMLLTSLLCMTAGAQERSGRTHSGRLTGQPEFPLVTYTELENPVVAVPQEWASVKGVRLSWASKDIRYPKEAPAAIPHPATSLQLTAWRGERTGCQWAIWGDRDLEGLTFSLSDLRHSDGKSVIPETNTLTGFVRYVMTDELNRQPGKKNVLTGCGHRPDLSLFDSSLVADPIDHLSRELDIKGFNTQPGWITIRVPMDAKPGIYKGVLSVKDNDGEIGKLDLRLKVLDRTLPAPQDWKFHLDLWQNPFAVARYHKVKPWSEEHLALLRPYMEMYRDAGGKVITASIMHKPWNGQTYDPFETMVTWMKKADGTWAFDYTVFDTWIEFMMDLGIDSEINCYSMVPWLLKFQYFDQATNSLQFIDSEPGEPEYNEMWGAMLKSFSKHLREKGWFSRTHIAMDERPEKIMKETLAVIRMADPEFKVSFAGVYHEDLAFQVNDYSLAFREKFPEDIRYARSEQGLPTTFYTCCTEAMPNTFTFSAPAEAEWLGWYAAKEHLDGYLRWALNSWGLEPLLDSRFITWAAGDTFLIYPGPRSCIRFERLINGIQDYEKVRILREEFEKEGNARGLRTLQEILDSFDEGRLNTVPAAGTVNAAVKAINRL